MRYGRFIVPVGIVLGCCLLAYNISGDVEIVYFKLSGQTTCTWKRLMTARGDNKVFGKLRHDAERAIVPDGSDPQFGIDHFRHPTHDFWIKHQGDSMDGRTLLGYLLAEHAWMQRMNPENGVRPGDIVVDCGAHVGVFV